MMRNIILASGSPRREELLSQMGLGYEVIVSDVDEDGLGQMPPDALVMALARLKAQAVAKSLEPSKKDAIVIGADTLVALDEEVLGKPKDSQDAKRMLKLLSGKMHLVYTGVSLVDRTHGKEESFFQSTKVYMKKLSDSEIEDYVLSQEPLGKAGSYGIQGKGGVFIEKIEGDYFSVMGLPIGMLYDYLKGFK